MIQLIENYITQEDVDAILSNYTLRPERHKDSEHPDELGDYVYPDVPEAIKAVMKKLLNDDHFTVQPDAVNVHEYMPRQYIDEHIDDETYGETVAVITLLGQCDMIFSKEGETNKTYNLTPKSLIVWNGQERWFWKHSLTPTDSRRISLVIRKQKD